MNKVNVMLFTAILLWGLTVPPTKWALETIHPFTLMFLRLLLASLLFLPYAWKKERSCNPTFSIPWWRISVLSFTGVAGYFLFGYYGIALTSGIHASILWASIPLFTLLLAAVYLREQIALAQWIGLLVGIIGVVLISVQPGAADESSVIGDLFVLASSFMWAIYVIQMKRPKAEAKLTSELFTALTMLMGTLMISPFAVVETIHYGLPIITWEAFASIFFLAVGSTIFGYWLWNKAIEQTSATQAGVFLNALPLVSVLSSICFLGETVSWRTFVGGCLVLLGVLFAERARRPVSQQADIA